MTVDRRGREAASALEQYVRSSTDTTQSLEALYARHASKAPPSRRRPVALAVAFSVVLIAVAGLAIVLTASHSSTPPASQEPRSPAPPTSARPQPTTTTTANRALSCVKPCITITVLDAAGQPLPAGKGRGLACPPNADQSTNPCVTAVADSQGRVRLQLQDGIEYQTNAAAVDIGWCNPGYVQADNGTPWWWAAEPAIVGPAAAADGAVFHVQQPPC